MAYGGTRVLKRTRTVLHAVALTCAVLAVSFSNPTVTRACAAQAWTACFYTEPAASAPVAPLSVHARSPSATLASMLADPSPLPFVADCIPSEKVHYLNAPDAQGRCRYLVFDAPRATYPFSPGSAGGTVASAATFAQAAAACAEEDAHEDDTLHFYRLYVPQAHDFDARGTCSTCGYTRKAAGDGGSGSGAGAGAGPTAGAGPGGSGSGGGNAGGGSPAGGGAYSGGSATTPASGASDASDAASGSTVRTKTGTATVGAGRYRLNADGTAVFAALANRKRTALTVPKAIEAKGCSYRVTAIGASACARAPKLKAVTVKAQVKSIGKKAFYRCTRLKKATVKSTVLKTLGASAFKGCTRLRSFACASKIGKEALKKACVL